MTREGARQAIDYYYCHTELLDEYGDYCDQTEYEKAFDIAIKALEQENILDKIRAEIAELEEGISSYHNDRPWVFKDEVLQIIDKYKAESEVQE